MTAGWELFAQPAVLVYRKQKSFIMKIILETLMAGPDGIFQPGEHDLPEKLAKELIKTGHAKPVEVRKVPARPVPETASLKPGETATA